MTTKTILCALDLSQPEPDDRVLKTAARLAGLYGATLEAITVVPDLGVGEVASYFPADFQENAIARTREALKEHVASVLGDKAAAVRCIVAAGSVYQEVLRVAEASKTDLIVVGSHKPAVRDYLLGTNASHIVLHASCSVYVVR